MGEDYILVLIPRNRPAAAHCKGVRLYPDHPGASEHAASMRAIELVRDELAKRAG